MNKKQSKSNSLCCNFQKGLTLVEMLVAMMMFVITIGAISGIFIFGVRAQRRILATQELLDQTSFVLEYMGRALRMAKKDTSGCVATAGNNYDLTNNVIQFLDHNEKCTKFYLDSSFNGRIKKGVWDDSSGVWEIMDLTSSALRVNFLRFSLYGNPQNDELQPRVTISLDVSGRETGFGGRPRVQMQTSVSQRNLDIQ